MDNRQNCQGLAALDRAAETYPDLTFIAGHMNGQINEMAMELPNVLDCTCAALHYREVEQEVKRLGTSRTMLLGSDFALFELAFGIGMVLALTLIQFTPTGTHRPPVFGVLGGVILALFLLMLWFWAKRRAHLEGTAKTVADLRVTGYVWLIIAMWYLCGTLGAPYLSAVTELDLGSPVPIILYLVLAWVFLFLAQYKEAKAMT